MNRFNLFVICSLFFLETGSAANGVPAINLNFQCVSALPTTSFYVETIGNEVILTTIHHHGTDFMPIHDGVIVPFDIKYLLEKSKYLIKMGNRNEFRFPLSKCRVYGKSQMSCAGGNTQMFEETEMEGMMLSTALLSETIFGKTFNRTKVNLTVHIKGYAPVQNLSMIFSEEDCRFDF